MNTFFSYYDGSSAFWPVFGMFAVSFILGVLYRLSNCPVRRAVTTAVSQTSPSPATVSRKKPLAVPVSSPTGKDDLKVIEGIGPKIEQLLNEAKITTWSKLAETAVADIKHILHRAGPRFEMHNPKTWPEQASLAAQGRWEELKAYQKYLIGGVDPAEMEGAMGIAPEDLVVQEKKLSAADGSDDLTVIEGIGPKIAWLLNDAGISSWKELAETSVFRLQSILDEAGPRFKMHNPASWPQQARYCANGQWQQLKEYQDKLHAGKA